jgi:hypothetical protein
MNKVEPPEAYGVLKPVGHVIVSFPTDADMRGAQAALRDDGFGGDDVVVYSPAQMKAQADKSIAEAGILSTVGQELNLVKALRDLAEQGYSFLVVRAPKDEQAQRVAQIAQRFHAQRAQKFGHLIIEELITVGSGEKQVAESPDRGIDAGNRSGVEGADAGR